MDFAEREDGASPVRIAALLLGAAAMALAIAAFQDIQSRTAQLEAEFGRIKRPAGQAGDVGPAGTAKLDDAVKRANAVARELARRWDKVFAAIEAVGDADVALLAIEPDAHKGIVRITAESRNKHAMLRYLTRLQDRQPLQRVLLEHHEVRTQEPERPVRFVVSGEWEEAP
jgi:Tfp pilus assembly protein PilN